MAIDEHLAELYRQFDKKELLEIAGELELDVNERMPVTRMLKVIIEDLDEEGVPEECSDLLNEFLYAAEYIDDEGEIIDVVDEDQDESKEEEDKPDEDELEEDVPESMKPACFSLADDRDPACNRCKVFQQCLKTRLKRRPECFGVAYNQHAEECKVCVEAPFCRLETQRIIQVQ